MATLRIVEGLLVVLMGFVREIEVGDVHAGRPSEASRAWAPTMKTD
jgi:hypothetical protein